MLAARFSESSLNFPLSGLKGPMCLLTTDVLHAVDAVFRLHLRGGIANKGVA